MNKLVMAQRPGTKMMRQVFLRVPGQLSHHSKLQTGRLRLVCWLRLAKNSSGNERGSLLAREDGRFLKICSAQARYSFALLRPFLPAQR